MDTDDSQDHRGRERAIFHGHWRFTGLEGKGEGHLSWILMIQRTTRKWRGPSFMDTDDSQDHKGRERVIFHGYWRFTGPQGNGEWCLSWILTIYRNRREGRRSSFMDTDDSQNHKEMERAVFHEYLHFTGAQGKWRGPSFFFITTSTCPWTFRLVQLSWTFRHDVLTKIITKMWLAKAAAIFFTEVAWHVIMHVIQMKEVPFQ